MWVAWELTNYQIKIKADKTPVNYHKKCFNSPSTNEVAIVMVGTECEKRDIIIDHKSLGLQRISETHRWYDSLQYPLLLWEGSDGYNFKVMQINPQTGVETSKKVIY